TLSTCGQVKSISFTNPAGFTETGLSAKCGVTLTSSGAVAGCAGAISAATLTLKNAGTFTLTAANTVGTISTCGQVKSLSFTNAACFVETGLSAQCGITLASNKTVTGCAGVIAASSLTLKSAGTSGSGAFNLGAANTVASIATCGQIKSLTFKNACG